MSTFRSKSGQTLEIFGLYWAWFYLFHALGDHFIYSSATVFLILNNHHVRINYLSKCDKLWTLWIRTIIMFVIIMVTMRTTQKIVYTPLFLRLPSNMSFYLHSTKEINWRKCIQWSEKKHLKKNQYPFMIFFLISARKNRRQPPQGAKEHLSKVHSSHHT